MGEDKPSAKVLGYQDHAPSPLAAETRQEKQKLKLGEEKEF